MSNFRQYGQMKSRDGKSQRREEKKKEIKKEKVRRKKMKVRKKVGKSRSTEMMKKCTPLWRNARFQVKMYKAHQRRTTFGSCDVEKCAPLWRKARFEVKMHKTHQVRTTLGSWDDEKVYAVVAREASQVPKVEGGVFWRLWLRHVLRATPFAPRRRALFEHVNFQKCSEHEVFLTFYSFWLRHLFRATVVCAFWFLIWPDGSAPASLASLRFDPPEPQALEKHGASLFAQHLLSSDSFL